VDGVFSAICACQVSDADMVVVVSGQMTRRESDWRQWDVDVPEEDDRDLMPSCFKRRNSGVTSRE
jgi:hypothetical protein